MKNREGVGRDKSSLSGAWRRRDLCSSERQLGSQYPDPELPIFDYLPETLLGQVANLGDPARVLVLDKSVENADGRQVVFTRKVRGQRYHAMFIDQSYALNAYDWDFPKRALRFQNFRFARDSINTLGSGRIAKPRRRLSCKLARLRTQVARVKQNMPHFFAFLRAINAGPKRTVRMNVLCRAFESLGFSRVATFLGSGNVVFEAKAKNAGPLEKKIERRLRQALGYSVPVFIRTHAELKEIANCEPFDNPAILGADVNVILLAHNLDEKSKARLIALTTETDGFHVRGREIYWWRRKKPGTSLYSTVPFAKVLSEPFTIRSTNTIRRLVAK